MSHFNSLALLGQLAAFFDAGTVRAGRALAGAGAVKIVRDDRSDEDIFIGARVKEGKQLVREVDIRLDLDDSGAVSNLFSMCSCPLASECEHVVAVLVAFGRGNETATEATDETIHPPQTAPTSLARMLSASLAPEPPPWPAFRAGPRTTKTAPRPATAPTLAPPPAPVNWLESLERDLTTWEVLNEPRNLLSAQLLYLLHTEPETRLAIVQCPVLSSGMRGKPVPWHPQPTDLCYPRSRHSLVDDADVLPLRLYLGLQQTQHPTAPLLEGEAGALLLNAALATGRLYLAKQLSRPLAVGALRPLQLSWTVDSQGRQRLAVQDQPSLHLIATQPPAFVDTASFECGELQTELPVAALTHLLQAPPLNNTDALKVRAKLAAIGQRSGVALPLPKVPEVLQPGRPVARVVLRLARFRHHAVASMIDEYPAAELHFDYPLELHVCDEDTSDSITHSLIAGKLVTWQRDLASESRVRSLLKAEGMAPFVERLGNYLRVDSDDSCLMPLRSNAVDWMPFLSEGVPRLKAHGVHVVIDDDFPYGVEIAEDWFVEVDEVGSSCQWFDLELGVIIHGEKISLVPPLLRLIKQQPTLLDHLRELGDEQAYPVALDDKRVLPVPAGRLKAWLLPLLELIDPDRPRLSGFHAGLLSGLDDGSTQWLGSEAVRRLAQRLQDFSGIAEHLPAPGFTASLRPYQQAGLNWLQFLREFNLAGILADDMGLGKTVQTLAHLHLEKVSGRADRPSLVVATTSLMSNWRQETARFTPELKVLVLHGADRREYMDEIDTADLVLTTYPLLVRDRETLLAREYHLLIMDEAQFIKNPKAQSHQVARQLRARHRLSLTGTPLENHLGELWAQFDFLMRGFLGDQKRFVKTFRTPIEKFDDDDARTRLADRVRPFLLRRTKEDVLTDLPPRTEIVRWIEIEGGQRDLYESLRIAFDKKLRTALVEQGIGRSQIMILDALLKLRQVCCDPRLVKLPSAVALVKSGAAKSAKLIALMEMLEELIDEGRRILLFSQFTSMFELIEPELAKLDIRFSKLTGQTVDRAEQIAEFQEGRVPLFLISLKAGGTGLNLTAADTVIHYDPWWNPAVEEQATARAHRMGQDKPVFVYKLMTQGTVEEKILALQDRKRGLADQLMRKKSAGAKDSGHLLSAADLDVLFQPLA